MNAPFFIVGSARSGTTLLRLMLNAHPEVAVPPESRFVVELYRGDTVEVEGFLQALGSHKQFRTWDLPLEAVRHEIDAGEHAPYAEAVTAVYRAYMRLHGGRRWGDKTPRYVEHIPLLSRLFPDARFVHLVRDGRNVALSYADVPFGPRTVGGAARLWARRVRAGIDDGRPLGERYLELRYEDMVEDAEEHAKRLCAFLELAFDPEMLNYTERARDAILDRARRYNPNVMKGEIKRTRSWEEEMPPFHVEVFEAIAGDELSLLDYDRRYPAPSLRARVAGAAGRDRFGIARLRGSRPL
ncbi:MAG TPA: sulfotransferase [Actinomycetota bacterium]|nr:sulfotransferase [Actinomycetota bacterium]